jgi:lipid A 3-O-deacylase
MNATKKWSLRGFHPASQRRLWAWLLLALAPASLPAQDWLHAITPSTVFVQAGAGDQQARAYVGGASWDWSWRHSAGPGTLTGYFEAAFGRWTTRHAGEPDTVWPTQLSVTPVLRFQPSGAMNPWFAEIGVGGNYLVPVFRDGHKQFSSKFNFGDHAAIGRQFGARLEHALAVRVEHFSNAGIEHPNPGEDFVQLRYSYRF